MGRWRVGTLTMGISLIVLGGVLLVSLLGQQALAQWVIQLWPIALIGIGGEVLWAIGLEQKKGLQIKYDFFSMVMIFVIFTVSLGLYGLTASGVVEGLAKMTASRTYPVAVTERGQVPESGIEKIVIRSLDYGNLELETATGSQLVCRAVGRVYATSEASAQQWVEQGLLRLEQVEGILYVELAGQWREGDFSEGITQMTYTLFLPQEVAVEIQGRGNRVSLGAGAVQADWQIQGAGTVAVRGNEQADVTLRGRGRREDDFQGSLAWGFETTSGQDGQWVEGIVVYGDGTYLLDIYDADQIIAE